MTRANVSELKAKLSAYLGRVRRGEAIEVVDRKTPVARLVPIASDEDGLQITPAAKSPAGLRELRPVRTRKRVDIQRVLRESRED